MRKLTQKSVTESARGKVRGWTQTVYPPVLTLLSTELYSFLIKDCKMEIQPEKTKEDMCLGSNLLMLICYLN